MKAKRLALLGLLTTIALIIFVVELRIPNIAPVPGMKLGLANIVTVYAVYHCTAKETALILFTRIILGSLFGGNMLALLYSLGGGIMCLLGMLLLRKVIDEKHIWVCSVLGAVLHNIGQIIVAAAVMQTAAVITYLPFLLVSGCVAGLLTGLCAQLLTSRINLNDF